MSDVTLTVQDGGLGIIPEAIDGITAKVGCCSSGTANTVYSFSDQTTLKSTLGEGPLVEAAAHLLTIAGGPVYCVRATAADAGAAGAVTQSGTGPIVTVAGEAYDDYEVRVKIITGGALGTGTFQYSLDGASNYSYTITLPSGGTYAISGTNLTLTFASGTYVADEVYSFDCTAPKMDATTLTTALTALMADLKEWRFVHVVGHAATIAGTVLQISALETALTTAATNYRWVRGFIDCADDTDGNITTAIASVSPARVALVIGFEKLTSSVSGRAYKRPAGWAVTARAAKIPVHEDPGWVGRGSLPGVTTLYRDERATAGMDSQRCTTLRTYIGLSGAYITACRTLAGPTSDFQLIQNGFVIDKACRLAYVALLPYLRSSVRVSATTGYILEEDALAIEADVGGQLTSGLLIGPNGATTDSNASGVGIKISRTENILSTETMPVQVRVIPLGYLNATTVTIGLYNPALTPV